MPDAESIRAALRCGQSGCDCVRGNVHCPCPNHVDEKPSFNVSEKGGKILFHCHGTCTQGDVVEALKARSLWTEKKQERAAKRIVNTYDYTDERGELLHQTVRYEPKDFRQRQPDGRGGWVWNLKDVRPVLYRLPSILCAVESGETIYLCEGEKDADRLRQWGLPSTTNPMGAEKWRPEYSECLRNAHIVILPDNDPAGYKHVEKVGQSLLSVAASVRLIELPGLPHKGDVSDWIAKGGTADALLEMVTSAPPWKPAPQPRREMPAEHLLPFRMTDYGNAERLVRYHGADLRYCSPWSRWMVWDGCRWAEDQTGEVVRRAKATVRGIYGEASKFEDDNLRAAAAKHARESEKAARISAMILLAESEPGVPVVPDELDADPWLLNCENGTLNLKTGGLRPHDRNDGITKLCPVKYIERAECPHWQRFLACVVPDPEVRAYLKRAAGYSLTGDCSERIMLILHGSGRNGKSTFLETLKALLGDYAMRTPTEMLMMKHEGGIPNDLARLKGARFVFASEAEEGRRLAESVVKDITGGDTISARFLRAEWFDFTPQFKLWLGTNHRPTVRGTDQAIWDRLPLIPFTVRIPDSDVIPRREMMAALTGEMSGILRWAVEGCLEYQRDGLQPPAAIRQATQEYRAEMDVLGTFIDDRCRCGRQYGVKATDLYSAYKNWCDQGGERCVSQTDFGRRLNERGFESNKKGGVVYRIGLDLASESLDMGSEEEN